MDLSLVEGENTITVNATDPAGNTGTAAIALILDTVLPVITVTTPVHNSYVNTPKITLSGTVTESNPDGFWVNGEEKQLTNNSFSILDFGLSQGINVIRFKANDKAGNEATASVFVTLDTTQPTVTITSPLNGSITNNATTTITGAVNEPVTYVAINGQSAQVFGTGFILANFSLAEGDNTIAAEAVDRAGNSGTSADVVVTFDTQPPAVTIDTPGQAAAGQTITITAGATENRGLTLIEVTADGTPVWTSTLNAELSTSNFFSYTISPDTTLDSVVTLQAQAYDMAGNTGSASTQVQITSGPTGPGYIQGEV